MTTPAPTKDRDGNIIGTQREVRLTDTTLRDGSHPMRHRFTEAQVRQIVHALDDANVEVIEVTHGDGLGGSSFNYGFSLVDSFKLIEAAVEEAKQAKIACLLLPGLGTIEDIKHAAAVGAKVIRIATHCTEADISIQHFGAARELGLETVGFLMLSHRVPSDILAQQASIMADAGCQCVYVVDSAGALIMEEAGERVKALVDAIGDRAQVGFHGHQNMSLGLANSVFAYRNGARQIDCATCALGAGAGNTPTEVMAAVFDRLGVDTGIDVFKILDVAEKVVRPIMDRVPFMDHGSIMQGYAGVYSSFLLHAERAAERYGIPAPELLWEAGQRGMVGGQEDMLIDIALEKANAKKAAAGAAA